MRYWFCLLLPIIGFAEEPAQSQHMQQGGSSQEGLFRIDPKARASDLVEAFQFLKTDKPTFKISLRATNGQIYQGLTDLTAATNGTLLYLKVLSNHGSKTVIVPTEEIEEIFYSQ